MDSANMNKVKHCCKNCHFLNKTSVQGNTTWTENERDNLQVADHYVASCWRGIWSAAIDAGLKSHLPELLTQNRRDECFFVEYHRGMEYQAATELHRVRNDNRQLRKGYRYTQIALGIAATGLVVSAIVGLIQLMAPCGG